MLGLLIGAGPSKEAWSFQAARAQQSHCFFGSAPTLFKDTCSFGLVRVNNKKNTLAGDDWVSTSKHHLWKYCCWFFFYNRRVDLKSLTSGTKMGPKFNWKVQTIVPMLPWGMSNRSWVCPAKFPQTGSPKRRAGGPITIANSSIIVRRICIVVIFSIICFIFVRLCGDVVLMD